MATDATASPALKLPAAIATKTDLVNVLRNLEDILDIYVENTVRSQEGVDFSARSDVSSNLAALVQANNLSVDVRTLQALKSWLVQLKEHAPVVRFTFASDPTPEFLGQISQWLRETSGQFVLMRYGIQPTIAAGCLLTTPVRRYDFSLRSKILKSGDIFARIVNDIGRPATTPTEGQQK